MGLLGRAHKGRPTKLLIADQDIRIIHPTTGELTHKTHPQPHTRLPTHQTTPTRPRSPETPVPDVPRHHIYGDGGNRTRVRSRVWMASTSVAGALISSLASLAGRVVRDQPPEMFPDRRRRASPGEPTF